MRSRIFSRLNGLLERLLLLDRLNDIYAEMDKREKTGDFVGRALAALKIGYHVEPDDMARIPVRMVLWSSWRTIPSAASRD